MIICQYRGPYRHHAGTSIGLILTKTEITTKKRCKQLPSILSHSKKKLLSCFSSVKVGRNKHTGVKCSCSAAGHSEVEGEEEMKQV